MKRTKIILITALVLLMATMLSGCALVDRVMGWVGLGDKGDPEIRAVYDAYATYTAAAGAEPLDYASWLASIKGERGESVSVSGCSVVANTTAGTTYRLSFSDGSYADFTVPKPGGDRAEDLETLLNLVTVERAPSRTEGQSTVASAGGTSSKEITSTFVGWSFYMTKTAMFGESDEVVGIFLNAFNFEAVEGVDSAELTIEFLSIDGKESFLKANVVTSYTVDVVPKGVDDYYLDVAISREDLDALGEEFMIGFVFRGSPRVRMQASQNSSYVLASAANMQKKLDNGTMCYSGYYTRTDATGARVNLACSHSANTPDIFFSSAIEETVTINGDIRVQHNADRHMVYRFFTIYQCESSDGGKTWTKPYPILDRLGGSPPHLYRHSSGTLICTYTCREAPYATYAMLSRDEGATWETNFEINVNGVSHDLGYPSTVELKDGSLITVFYAHPTRGEPAVVIQQQWRIEE